MKFTDFFLLMCMLGLLLFGVESYFSTPEVYWSTSSDKCVKIIHDGIEVDCSEMPEKYERIWVK